MDERATHSPTGTVDVASAVTADEPARAGHPPRDGATAHGTELRRVLRAIAERIDVVLDEKVASGAAPEDRHRAAPPWSSMIAERAPDATSELQRNALATTVLRISADGRVDVDEKKAGAIEGADHDVVEGTAEEHAAEEYPAEEYPAEEYPAEDVADSAGAVTEEGIAESCDVSGLQVDAATDPTERSDVEDRLRTVRERLATRRASATTARVGVSDARAPRVRVPVWRRTETRILVQRLLIGLAIVGASAVVSILIT